MFFHSYERQGIQTKNPFDEILCLSFDLRSLKMNTYGVRQKSILQNIIKRTHIIKNIWWEKEEEDKDLLTTFKNIHTLKYVKF